ncbi:MAG: phage/plasmid primase, P4 family, partial [Thermoplasmata archaeon]|nr:phage/plasmid primase, P4 family [Thermoplasmata archaeon]
TLNLRTKEIVPHDPDVPFLYVLPVGYDPWATAPKFEGFGARNINDQKVWDFLGEWFGYTFYEGNDLKHATVLYGHTNTGRTTLLRIIEGVLGPDACSAISLFELARHKYALGALRGKLANICDDMSRESVPDLSMFKRITGSSPVEVEEKYKDQYAAVLGVKLTFTCNELPELKDADDAVWGRWFAIEFTVQIPEDQQVPRLWEDIVHDEGSGVLNWMLAGYDRVRNRGRFGHISTIEETKKRWVLVSDSFTAWARDRIRTNPKRWVGKQQLMVTYEAWCEDQGVPAAEYAIVGKKVPKLFPVVSQKKGGTAGWSGIELTSDTGSSASTGRQGTFPDDSSGGAGGGGGGPGTLIGLE